MANLNLPFVLLQPSLCSFKPTIAASKIVPYHKYHLKSAATEESKDVPLRNRTDLENDKT